MHELLSTPSAQTAQALADWLELNLIFGRASEFASTAVRDFLQDDFALKSATWDAFEDEDDPYPDVGGPAGEVRTIELRVDDAVLLLERRARPLGDLYPIDFEDGALVGPQDWRDCAEFAFLTLLAARHRRWLVLDANEVAIAALLFEHLVATAVARYLDGEAARFGWPPDQDEFTGSFSDRVKQLSDLVRERRVPEPSVVSPKQSDMGLDVIGWKFLDERTSKLVMLCQCAIGITEDLTEHKVETDRWAKVLSFASRPVAAVATSRDMLDTPRHEWEAIATVSGIVLDRTRLSLFADADLRAGLRARLVDWCESAHPKLSVR